MKNKGFTKSRYIGIVIIVSAALFIANLAIGIIITISSRTAVKEIIYRNMSEVSDTAAALVSGDDFKEITKNDRENKTEKYKKIYDILTVFAEKNSIAFIYAVRDSGELDEDGNKKFVFIVDPDRESESEYGEEIVYTKALLQASKGETSIDDEATEDKCPQCQQVTIINESDIDTVVFNLND